MGVDREATIAAYRSSRGPDPACCNACATFLLAITSGALSKPLLELLDHLGVDAAKPVEAWGAPDGGFLQVWWPFIGTIGPKQGIEQGQPGVVAEGQAFRITTDYPHPDWSPPPGFDVPAVELTWTGEAVRELERRAWTPARR